jgi:hypothetical protein
MTGKTAIERAFELATSGKFPSVSQLRTALKHEGYAVKEIDGPALVHQLRHLIHKSKRSPADPI